MRKGMKHFLGWVVCISLGCSVLTTLPQATPEDSLATQVAVEIPETTAGSELIPEASPTLSLPPAKATPTLPAAPPQQSELIQPGDLEYLGAFRLPDSPPEIGWEYSGASVAFNPGGDAGGEQDGFPGSIYASGHDWNQYVSEISIPVPVNSTTRNLDELNTATTLQDFHNIRGDLFSPLDFEIPRSGLAILPAQGAQTSSKLYFCWHQHMGEGDIYPTHGWSELDLADPQTAGPWRVAEYWNYVTCDYLFEIPEAWAEAYTPGMRLATGRFRDGGQGGMGPSLLAIGPWNEGNPPAPGSTLAATPLLLYSSVYEEEQHTLNGYHPSDEWSGGAWISAGEKSAVVFIGTKGLGENWYGCRDGTVWPDEAPFPAECPERGWWSTQFEGQMLFYNPAELAAVAVGQAETWTPQPYAVLKLDAYLFHVVAEQEKSHVGSMDFDRENGLLYVFEPLADEAKSLVHVWRVVP